MDSPEILISSDAFPPLLLVLSNRRSNWMYIYVCVCGVWLYFCLHNFWFIDYLNSIRPTVRFNLVPFFFYLFNSFSFWILIFGSTKIWNTFYLIKHVRNESNVVCVIKLEDILKLLIRVVSIAFTFSFRRTIKKTYILEKLLTSPTFISKSFL